MLQPPSAPFPEGIKAPLLPPTASSCAGSTPSSPHRDCGGCTRTPGGAQAQPLHHRCDLGASLLLQKLQADLPPGPRASLEAVVKQAIRPQEEQAEHRRPLVPCSGSPAAHCGRCLEPHRGVVCGRGPDSSLGWPLSPGRQMPAQATLRHGLL